MINLEPFQIHNLTMQDFYRIRRAAEEVGIKPKTWVFQHALHLKEDLPTEILGIPCEIAPMMFGKQYDYSILAFDVVLLGDSYLAVVSSEGEEGVLLCIAENAKLFTPYKIPSA